MFRASSCPSSGATTTAVAASGLPLERGGSSAVVRGRADRPDHEQQHCYHQAPTVNQRLILYWLIQLKICQIMVVFRNGLSYWPQCWYCFGTEMKDKNVYEILFQLIL